MIGASFHITVHHHFRIRQSIIAIASFAVLWRLVVAPPSLSLPLGSIHIAFSIYIRLLMLLFF